MLHRKVNYSPALGIWWVTQ